MTYTHRDGTRWDWDLGVAKGGEERPTKSVGFFFKKKNEFRSSIYRRLDADPKPKITLNLDPKPDPKILRPAQNLSSRVGSIELSGGSGPLLSPSYK